MISNNWIRLRSFKKLFLDIFHPERFPKLTIMDVNMEKKPQEHLKAERELTHRVLITFFFLLLTPFYQFFSTISLNLIEQKKFS